MNIYSLDIMNNNSKYILEKLNNMKKQGVCLGCALYDHCDIHGTFGILTHCSSRKSHFFWKIENLIKKYLGGEKIYAK
jgi:hypothetical protein